MTRKKSTPHHREAVSTEVEGYKMLWSSIENDDNTVQRVPSLVDPKGSHPVATMVDSGDDSHDGISDDSCSNRIGIERIHLPSADSIADSSVAILPSVNSSTQPTELPSLNGNQPLSLPTLRPFQSLQSTSVSQFSTDTRPCDSFKQDSLKDLHRTESDSNAATFEEHENTSHELVHNVENFSSRSDRSENRQFENNSSSESTQFSDLIQSPQSVLPLVELSDLTPLLGNSPQSPGCEDRPEETEIPLDDPTPVDDVTLSDEPDVPTSKAHNLETPETSSKLNEGLTNSHLPVEQSLDEHLPSADSAASPPTASIITSQPSTTIEDTIQSPQQFDPNLCQDIVSDPVPAVAEPYPIQADFDPAPIRADFDPAPIRADLEPAPIRADLESKADDIIEDTQVRSPSTPAMRSDEHKDDNECISDPVNSMQSDDDSCVNDNEVAASPAAGSCSVMSTSTAQALNLLRAKLVSNDDDDFSKFACIEPLGPDFDPSSVDFLTPSEINKEMFGHQLGDKVCDGKMADNIETEQNKDSIFNVPPIQAKCTAFDEEDFPDCLVFLPHIIKIEPEFKSKARNCLENFFECIIEDNGLHNIQADTGESSSDFSDTDSIDDNCCLIPCKVILERIPPSVIKYERISLTNRLYVSWKRNISRERNEEMFRHLNVWRKGRLLLWRECQLAGMDRKTYDRQVDFIRKHKIEVGSSDSDSSDSEEDSIEHDLSSNAMTITDSSDCDTRNNFDSQNSSSDVSPAAAAIIKRRKPMPKSELLKLEKRNSSVVPSGSTPQDEYVVERTVEDAERCSVAGKPRPLKITIRKTSVSKSEDESEISVVHEESSSEDIAVPIQPVNKKVRRVAMKRTTRRGCSPPPVSDPVTPPRRLTTESQIIQKTISPPDASKRVCREKKSFFFEENEEDETLLGRRADEVENHNLLERFEIPFEAPTLFRSPRVASKLAQLRNKEAFKSCFAKQTKAQKIDPIAKDVREVVDMLVLKTVEAILTQPRTRAATTHPHVNSAENPCREKAVSSLDACVSISHEKTQPQKLTAPETSTLERPRDTRKSVKTKTGDNFTAEENETDSIFSVDGALPSEISSSDFLEGEKEISSTYVENNFKAAVEPVVTSTIIKSARDRISENDPQIPSRCKAGVQDSTVEPDDSVDSSDCRLDGRVTTKTSKEQIAKSNVSEKKELTSENQPNEERRMTRATQPFVEVDLELIEILSQKKKKRPSTAKTSTTIGGTSLPESVDSIPKSDDALIPNETYELSADDSVSTSAKPPNRKKKRVRLSRFAKRRRTQVTKKPADSEESNNEKVEKEVSKSLVQVAEISEGKGAEHIPERCVLPDPPEPQFTPRVLRSHPNAATIICGTNASDKVDSSGPIEEGDGSDSDGDNVDNSFHVSAPSSPMSVVETECAPIAISKEPFVLLDRAPVCVEPEQALVPDAQPPIIEDATPETLKDKSMECDNSVTLDTRDFDGLGNSKVEIESPVCASEIQRDRKCDPDDSSALFDAFLAISTKKADQSAKPTTEEGLDLAVSARKNELLEKTGMGEGIDLANSTKECEQLEKSGLEEVMDPAGSTKDCEPLKTTTTKEGLDLASSPIELRSSEDLSKETTSNPLDPDNQPVTVDADCVEDSLNPAPSEPKLDSSHPEILDTEVAASEQVKCASDRIPNSMAQGLNNEKTFTVPETSQTNSETSKAAEVAEIEDATRSFLKDAEELDFSNLSNILNMADSSEDLVIDQPFSDEEPEQSDLTACILDIIENQIVIECSNNEKNVASSDTSNDPQKSKSKRRDSIDERTGLPTTLIQRLRDPRIRSKVMSQLEETVNVGPPRTDVPPAPIEPQQSDPTPVIDLKETPRPIESTSRDPRALRSSTLRARNADVSEKISPKPTLTPPAPLGIIPSHPTCLNPESIKAATVQLDQANLPSTAQTTAPRVEDEIVPAAADEEDEEEEALKRRRKKPKKTVDTELMYKSPLEDLEKEPSHSYSRSIPRRYPKNDSRPRGYVERKPNRWDNRQVATTGSLETQRHPDIPPLLPGLPQPHLSGPMQARQIQNQQARMMDSDCLPSYVESPHWQGNWINEQQFSPFDHRKNIMAARIESLRREQKMVNLKQSPVRNVVLKYIENAFIDILPKPPFDLNPDDKEIVISMMDPFGQEIDMLQLPRPTATLTKDYLKPVSHYQLIDDMVPNQALPFSCYMDEEKIDEQVIDFFDEGDADKIVRMQSHVPAKRLASSEWDNMDKKKVGSVMKPDKECDSKEDTLSKNCEKEKRTDSQLQAEKTESSTIDLSTDDFQKKTEKKPDPPEKQDGDFFLHNILNHLPSLKKQYAFSITTAKDVPQPAVAPDPPMISDAYRLKKSLPDPPASPSPPSDPKGCSNPRNPSPPRIMKAILNLTKKEKPSSRLHRRHRSKRSRSPSGLERMRPKSPATYRSHRLPQDLSRSPPSSRKPKPESYRVSSHRKHSPSRHRRRRRVSKDTISSTSGTPRYSRSSLSSSISPRRRNSRASCSRSPSPLPRAYRRSSSRSPTYCYMSRSDSRSPPRKRSSKH